MGADFRAYAVIGLRVDEERLYGPPKKVKAFEHNHPEDWEVDPRTGKKLWYEERPPLADYDPQGTEKILGYKVVTGTWTGRGRDAYICLHFAGNRTYSNGGQKDDLDLLNLPELQQSKEKMKEALSPLGIWNEKEFGLWAVLYCSC